MTDHAGTVVEDIVFYPWGDVWQYWGGGGFNFATMPYDETITDTNLTMFRLQSPNLGRWLSPDPLGGDIANPQSLNRYAYVMNNPTSLIDPLGLCDPQSGIPCHPVYDPSTCDGIACSGWTAGGSIDPFFFLDYLLTGEGFFGGGPGDWGTWYGPIFNGTLAWLLLSGGAGAGGPGGGSSGAQPQAASPCSKIAGRGGVVPVSSPNGEWRFQFNAQGDLIGLGAQLTGNAPATAWGLSIPPSIFFGARLETSGAITIGFTNPVRTGYAGIYFQSATFSNGQFSNVNGALQALALPLGSPSTPSVPLTYLFNASQDATSAAAAAQNLLTSLSQAVTCSMVFGSVQ
jgi:RHS repeat-associated protein